MQKKIYNSNNAEHKHVKNNRIDYLCWLINNFYNIYLVIYLMCDNRRSISFTFCASSNGKASQLRAKGKSSIICDVICTILNRIRQMTEVCEKNLQI